MTTSPALDINPYIDEQVSIALARLNFWEYCLYFDLDFFTRRPFLKEVADGFQWIYEEYKEGRARKVAVSMPPRSGKSYILSLFCSWFLGKEPEKSIMRNACTDTLYTKFSYDVRAIVKSPAFMRTFPKAKLAPDKQNVGGWNLETAKQVSYFGGGVGGTIIGFGANIAMSDDLYKDMSAALSETVQNTTASWKQSAHNSRMEKHCPEIYLGTRWTKNDEIGKAIEEGKVDLNIVISALVDGKSFCEDVKTTQEYLTIKADTDEAIWEAEYQQEPIEAKGLLFPKSELKFYNPQHIPLDKAEYKFTYVDPADEGGDFLAAPDCYLIGSKIYVPRVIFNKDGTDVNGPALEENFVGNKIHASEIEGNSAWKIFGKDLRTKVQERMDCDIRIINNTVNKQTRILAQSAFIKNHFYFDQEYENDTQYKAFIKNLTSYLREGKVKNDDAPDALAGCANHFRNNFSHLW